MLRTVPPIAMLHAVSDVITDPLLQDWCITKKNFIQLLDFIEERNIQTTHFAEIVTAQKKSLAQQHQVILTFDDCLKHLLDFAVPELLKRNMKAVFYAPTAFIGGCNVWDVKKGAARMEVMDANDLKALSHAGMEIGSHSHQHRELTQIKDAVALQEEATHSKSIIENITGQKVYSFSYPFGMVPAAYDRILRQAGYQYAVSIYQPFQNNFALRRFGVYNKDTTRTISRKLSWQYKWSRKLFDAIKKY